MYTQVDWCNSITARIIVDLLHLICEQKHLNKYKTRKIHLEKNKIKGHKTGQT